jgi:uncharacterized protein
MTEREVKRAILEIIKKHVPKETKVFLFGSRVLKTNTLRSDFDIGLQATEPLPFGALAKIEDELEELPIMQKIDLVDFSKVSEGFKEFAMKHIE